MDPTFLLIQALNGLQYGLLLFLTASGLTLVLGIMGVINLAHGAFYMIGAYLALTLTSATGSLFWALVLGVPAGAVLGLVIERLFIAPLHGRDHLAQVLVTFGLILVAAEVRSLIWGNDVHGVAVPAPLAGGLPLTDVLDWPIYRAFVSGVCVVLAGVMALVLRYSRLGMRIRAAASRPATIDLLGLDARALHALVFSAGIALAVLAGGLAAPIESVYPGMGDGVLILSFVVVAIGGLGSVRGAFLAALAVGLVTVLGRSLVPELSGAAVYALMAAVLLWRPAGLFGRA